jgi:hypothetical protein
MQGTTILTIFTHVALSGFCEYPISLFDDASGDVAVGVYVSGEYICG